MIATLVSLIIINKISSKTKHHNNNRKRNQSPITTTTTTWNNFACYPCLCHTLYTIGFHSAIYNLKPAPAAIPIILPNYLYFLHAAIIIFDDNNIQSSILPLKLSSGMPNFIAFKTLAIKKTFHGNTNKLKV